MSKKVALVTGGMGGIGTAICQQLSDMGATVITSYKRSPSAALEWLKTQELGGYNFSIHEADVSNFESCKILVEKIQSEYGRIDILINNAAITKDVLFHKMALADWEDIMHTNIDSLFHMTRNVIEGMISRGYGRIVNISSINGLKGQFGQVNYASTKSAIYGFTKSLALEVAKKGITVNAVSPGYVETDMLSHLSDETLTKIVHQIPVGRLGKPSEIARVVCFLASEESSFITGANFSINGGQYMS